MSYLGRGGRGQINNNKQFFRSLVRKDSPSTLLQWKPALTAPTFAVERDGWIDGWRRAIPRVRVSYLGRGGRGQNNNNILFLGAGLEKTHPQPFSDGTPPRQHLNLL